MKKLFNTDAFEIGKNKTKEMLLNIILKKRKFTKNYRDTQARLLKVKSIGNWN